jgi:hypothetical protein
MVSPAYYIGIISILETYTLKKKLENFTKTRSRSRTGHSSTGRVYLCVCVARLFGRSQEEISAIPSELYSERFRVKIGDYMHAN